MFRILKKILLLLVLTNLKIAVILVSSVLFIFFRICHVILDICILPAQHLSNESPSTGDNSTQTVPHCSNPRVSASVQTGECIQTKPHSLVGQPSTSESSARNIPCYCGFKLSASVQTEDESSKQLGNFESQSSTEIIIYNLNSSQKLVITQGKSKSYQCESCKAVTEMATSEQVENKASPTTGFYGSNSSIMSIESDVIDSKIETGCSSSSVSSEENSSQNAGFGSQPVDIRDSNNEISNDEGDKGISFENINSTCVNFSNDTFNMSSDFENFENSPANIYAECEDPTINKQKTSSPLNKRPSPKNSSSSNMSIESDVIDSKIETGCSSSSVSSDEKSSQNTVFGSRPVDIRNSSNESLNVGGVKWISFENIFNACLNSLNDTFNICSELENFENNLANTFLKCEDPTITKQKTAIPLNESPNPQNLCNSNMFDAEQSQVTKKKVSEIGTNTENWGRESLGTSFKRRLSLPVKLNTTNHTAINFKLAQKQLIEEALKNTSRHEKSFKEIKYPFSSEISLDCKSNDEIDEKGVFSCSSYESLPVSDHLRNACNNNTLLSLYNENLHDEDDPDFSCIDNLVGEFSQMKSNLLVPNLSQNEVISSTLSVSGIGETNEEPDAMIRSDDFKNSNLVDEKNGATKLCSKINLSTRVTDMCNMLDKFVSSDVKLSSDRILNFDDNSGNSKQSEINDSKRIHLARNECKTSDNSILEQEGEENELNPIKFKFSSPFKSVFRDLDELSDEDNFTPCLLDNSEINKHKLDGLDEIRQQSYHKIAFIDESPPYETTHVNQDASNSCQATFLNEKPTFRNQNEKSRFRVKTRVKSKVKKNDCDHQYNEYLLPVRQQNECAENDNYLPVRQRDECAEYDNYLPVRQRDECAEYDNSVLPVRPGDNLRPTNISFREIGGNTSIRESTETSKNKRDRLIRLSRKNRWRTPHSKWAGDCENKEETKEIFQFSNLSAQQVESSIEIIPSLKTKYTNQSTLETNCRSPQSAPVEESTSSGGSTSDNSVVTVKDLQEMK